MRCGQVCLRRPKTSSAVCCGATPPAAQLLLRCCKTPGCADSLILLSTVCYVLLVAALAIRKFSVYQLLLHKGKHELLAATAYQQKG